MDMKNNFTPNSDDSDMQLKVVGEEL